MTARRLLLALLLLGCGSPPTAAYTREAEQAEAAKRRGELRSAAEHYLLKGFKNLYNLTGGIEAWSLQVDPKVPRY